MPDQFHLSFNKYYFVNLQDALETSQALKSMVGPANDIIGEVPPSREKSPSEVITTLH